MTTRTRKAHWAAGLWGLWLGLAVLPTKGTQDLYLNTGLLQATFPPEPLPVIDAIRVVNWGRLALTNIFVPQPLEFQNVLFWTNSGTWHGSPGYRFRLYDPQASGTRRFRMSSVFYNEGLLHPSAAEVSTDFWLLVEATNIINRGRLETSPFGQLNLTGDFVDLRGGELRFRESGDINLAVRTFDLHWGFSTNQIVGRFNAPPLTSPFHLVQTLDGLAGSQVVLPVGFTSHVQFVPVGASNFLIQAVYLYNGNPDVETEVRILSLLRYIRWRGFVTNPVTQTRVTNELYLTEFLTPGNYNFNLTNNTLYVASLNPLGAFRPFNFSLSSVMPPLYPFATVVPPQAWDPTVFTIGTNILVEATNSGYRTRVIPAVMVPAETEIGTAFSNVLGRVEILARQALDLREARISVPSYLRLESTHHFVGSTNAQIEAPYSMVRLGSTNGLLEVRHLQLPQVPRMVGDLHAWVGLWTNITADGIGLEYRVLMVSNYFNPSAEPMIQDLELKSPEGPREVRIADKLNVFRSLLIDAERLTVTTNPPPPVQVPPWMLPPFHPTGELNLLTNVISWADSLPRLRYLTNHGLIVISNVATFAGIRKPPYYPTLFVEPYEAIVNQGALAAHSLHLQARHFESDGSLFSEVGPLRLLAGQARLGSPETNLWGQIRAPLGNVELEADRLLVTNHVVEAGRRLVLGATNYLGDADTTNNVFLVRDGLTLTVRPAEGDLRGTTISNLAPAYSTFNAIVWAGEDRGPTPAGFTNNVALGRLILDGQFGSSFTFQGLGVSNALYVDQLILLNHATNELNNAFAALNIAPNLVIYYADLWVGGRRLAEPVDSSRYNQGRLRWVPTYAGGFYGSTNILIGTREIRVNTALRESTELDSDGDGIPNALDPVPIPVPEAVTPADVPLAVAFDPGTPPALVLTWPTLPWATNTILEASSPTARDWRVLLRTNFATLPLPPEWPCPDPQCLTNLLPGRASVRLPADPQQGARYYRVQIEMPNR